MLPRLVGGLLLVGVLAIPLATHPGLYGACPQTQAVKVLCPAAAPICQLCNQNICGTPNCPNGGVWKMDTFMCQPNPGQQTNV
jgi:hypothetical protein